MSGQGGYPPNQGGYPGHGGYQGNQSGYPSNQGGHPPNQGSTQGSSQGGYPSAGYPQGGGYPQGQWSAQGQPQGLPQGQPQGQPHPGYPSGPAGQNPNWNPGRPSAPAKKSPLLIIGIVVTAVVLLVALGGILIALAGGGGGTPGAPITPDASQPPPVSSSPTSESTSKSSASSRPSASSSPTGGGPSSGIDLGDGITLTPAAGFEVESQKTSLAVLTNGDEIFVGQVAELDPGSDPKQVVDSYHRQLASNYTNVTYVDAKSVNLGTSKLKGAVGAMSGTATSGSGSSEVELATLASVRASDGMSVVGTIYYGSSSDTDQVNADFKTMVDSMLSSQAKG